MKIAFKTSSLHFMYVLKASEVLNCKLQVDWIKATLLDHASATDITIYSYLKFHTPTHHNSPLVYNTRGSNLKLDT